jgi:hypothetical protein
MQRFLQVVQANVVYPEAQVEVLRQVGPHVYLTSRQLRELLGIFGIDLHRVQILTLFYFQVTDMCNEKIFRVRFDKREDLQKVRQRLGHATSFPFLQPEWSQFILDLKYHDHRLVLNAIATLMAKEGPENVKGLDNAKNPTFVDYDGVKDRSIQEMGMPRSWDDLDRVPKEGIFSACYFCAPEARKIAVRKQLLEKYGYWSPTIKEEDICWWSALSQAPSDVIAFMTFLTARYPDMRDGWKDAFRAIEGSNCVAATASITLVKFQDGLKRMKFKKFAGHHETKRIAAVYRYLDPSGEGGISSCEWSVLEQLSNELTLSLEEFVKFIARSVSVWHPEADLRDVWDTLDFNDDDSITKDEWNKFVKEKFNYFGPSEIIFNHLDQDGEGSISWDEFETLRPIYETLVVGARRRSIASVAEEPC